MNRARAKEFGLNLSQYAIGAIFSPEAPPGGAATADGGERGDGGRPFNLNTISQGISTADFYLTVPQAVVKFLASDTRHARARQAAAARRRRPELDAEPRRRDPGAATDVRRPRRAAASTRSRSTSFTYRTVGINVEMKPRVTFEDEIILEHRGREQHARRQHQHRRAEPADVRLAQGEDADAPARRRVEPARRPAARRRAQGR